MPRFYLDSILSGFTIRNGNAIGDWPYDRGGAIFCVSSSPTITNNIIVDNYSGSWGGAILCANSSAKIINNCITRNSTLYNGGAIYCQESSLTLINNTITANLANLYGGGIYCLGNSSLTIINTILWDNSTSEGSQIYIDTLDMNTCIVTFSNIQDTLWPGEGNISIDPLFRDPEDGDFHLMFTPCGDTLDSPCIDSGDPAILDSLLDCNWGMGWYRSDMGAYGGGDSMQVGIDDYSSLIPKLPALLQNYPNPFNASTIIQYNLPSALDVTIDIYDILGRRVETLVQEQQPAGYHQVVWNATGQSSGLYFYRIQAGEYVKSRRMLLLK